MQRTLVDAYIALKTMLVKWQHKKIRWIRSPLKVKVFLWLVAHKSVLTKDVLVRRGWKGKHCRSLVRG
jgi:hypothetical protein